MQTSCIKIERKNNFFPTNLVLSHIGINNVSFNETENTKIRRATRVTYLVRHFARQYRHRLRIAVGSGQKGRQRVRYESRISVKRERQGTQLLENAGARASRLENQLQQIAQRWTWLFCNFFLYNVVCFRFSGNFTQSQRERLGGKEVVATLLRANSTILFASILEFLYVSYIELNTNS